MSKIENKEEKKEEEIDWANIPPATLEDIMVGNLSSKKDVLELPLKDGTKKRVYVEYRKLKINETAKLGKLDYTKEGNEGYQRLLLSMSSIVPKFPDPSDVETWKRIEETDHAFITHYIGKINKFTNESNFLF